LPAATWARARSCRIIGQSRASAPEISYFAVRRFQISDLPYKGPFLNEGLRAGKPQIEALQQKYGIYTSSSLSQHPFECVIPSIKPVPGWSPRPTSGYTAKVVGHVDTDSEKTSYRQIIDEAEIFLSGKSIAKLWLNPYGFTTGTSSIEISAGQPDLRKVECALPESETSDGTQRCKETWIPPDSLK
jgi:hypothetical protein